MIYLHKWHSDIHLFDAAKNEFNDTVTSEVQEVWELVDTAKLIYYEEHWGKMLNNPIFSNLFTFKNGKRIDIDSYQIEHQLDGEGHNIFKKGRLYLYGSKPPSETIIPKKRTEVGDIDFREFWEKRYKKITKKID